jgi:hypothetical protein
MPYDFSDQPVYDLILRTHQPTELGGFTVTTFGGQTSLTEPLSLVCEKDGEPWPCAAITELREFDQMRLKASSYSPNWIAAHQDPRRGTRG